MKVIVAGLASIVVLILGGWQMGEQVDTAKPVIEEGKSKVTDTGGVTGTWYSFPAGLTIRFDADGTAYFGVDVDGTPIGYEAETWIESEKMSIRFTNYDGQDHLCRTAIGVYELRSVSDNNIQFVPVHDDCQLRVNALRGHVDLGFELVFHPVE